MNEWVKFDTWEFPHKTWRVHSARCTHAYITQLYIMSIQPVNKAAEHIWSIQHRYWKDEEKKEGKKEEKKEEEEEAVNAYLINK